MRIVVLVVILASFGNFPASASDLLVAAAADLARMEAPLNQMFKRIAGQNLRFVFGSSGLLTRQIENGAPYDVFLSANQQFVKDLAGSGRIQPDSVRVYAVGRLALYSRDGKFKNPKELAAEGVRHIAIANPAHAPYGVAAHQALERLGLWTRLEPKIVYGENIRQTLQYAESGNADAAITAWSLVFDRGGILLPVELHDPIRQAGGVLTSSSQRDLARRFLDMLASQDGISLLERFGLFRPLR
jgi:molybdate transport system substrate-binding protein